MIPHAHQHLIVNLQELLLTIEEHYLLGRTDAHISIERLKEDPDADPEIYYREEDVLERRPTLQKLFTDLTAEQNAKVTDPYLPLEPDMIAELYHQIVYGQPIEPLKEEAYQKWKQAEADDPELTPYPEFLVSSVQIAVLMELWMYIGMEEEYGYSAIRDRQDTSEPLPEFKDMLARLRTLDNIFHYLHLYEKALHKVKGRNVRFGDITERHQFVWNGGDVEVLEAD